MIIAPLRSIGAKFSDIFLLGLRRTIDFSSEIRSFDFFYKFTWELVEIESEHKSLTRGYFRLSAMRSAHFTSVDYMLLYISTFYWLNLGCLENVI